MHKKIIVTHISANSSEFLLDITKILSYTIN